MELNLGASALGDELGTEPPRGLVEVLSPGELRMLADSLGTAKRRQSQALDRAIKDALGHVPFVFRGAVELILL
ncbi:MAG TPA: hypothetical protein VG388_14320 [Solirubrobacteraceae bacterium]|jgi:hypothetical protein|nr:hypothetical protein [Solirubrobacteraceae bacterium]